MPITKIFYSTKTRYRESFDTPMYTEKLKSIEGKSKNIFPQLVGSYITYLRAYTIVAYLSIESEVNNNVIALDSIQDNIKNQNNNVGAKM